MYPIEKTIELLDKWIKEADEIEKKEKINKVLNEFNDDLQNKKSSKD